MITLLILLTVCCVGVLLISGIGMILLDPIIAILVVYGLYRLIKWLRSRFKK